MALTPSKVSEQVLQEIGEHPLFPAEIIGLVFDKVLDADEHLDADSIPLLFKWAQDDSLKPSLRAAVSSFFQTRVIDGKKELQEALTKYYRDELLKTKPQGDALSAEDDTRTMRYSEYFCAYLTSEKGIKQSNTNIVDILKLFSLSRLEAFFAGSNPGEPYKTPLGQPDKHAYLSALYSKGIHHEQLRNLIPHYDRGHVGSQACFYALEELPLEGISADDIIFLLDLPSSLLKYKRYNPQQGDQDIDQSNITSYQYLKSIASLLRSGKITVPQLHEYWRNLGPTALKRIEKGEPIETLIQEWGGQKKYSPFQRRLKENFKYPPDVVLSLTDKQAFILVCALDDSRGAPGQSIASKVTPDVLRELRQIYFSGFDILEADEGDLYDFQETGRLLLDCLHAGVPGEYFNQSCLSLEERIKTVFLGLQAGLSVSQVTDPGFSLPAFPSHGQAVLRVLSQSQDIYDFDQLMGFSREKVLALDAGIQEKIINDPKFHEDYIELLKQQIDQRTGWEKLKNISRDKLIFVKRQGVIAQMASKVHDLGSVIDLARMQKKLLTFELPLELVADLSFTQLSFIYGEKLPFVVKPSLGDNIHFRSTYEDRYWIAKQCTDFDIECLYRLNITLEQLRKHPHVGVDHIHAVEEGYPKEKVLACPNLTAIQELRKQLGRPTRVLDTEATRAFEKRLGKKPGALSTDMPVSRKVADDPAELYEVDVPADGTCLFYSVSFAYLLPVANNPASFKARFIKLFGEEVADAAEEHRKRFLNYNGSRHFIERHAEALEVLVNANFRKRLVEFMKKDKKELEEFISESDIEDFDTRMERMGDPGRRAWGDQPEIEAISRFLEMRVTVFNPQPGPEGNMDPKPGADHGHGKTYTQRIYLVHTTADPSVPKAGNHYHYLIDKRYIPLAEAELKDKKETHETAKLLSNPDKAQLTESPQSLPLRFSKPSPSSNLSGSRFSTSSPPSKDKLGLR